MRAIQVQPHPGLEVLFYLLFPWAAPTVSIVQALQACFY